MDLNLKDLADDSSLRKRIFKYYLNDQDRIEEHIYKKGMINVDAQEGNVVFL